MVNLDILDKIHNPLKVFAVLLFGEGPLLYLYLNSPYQDQTSIILYSIIIYLFSMSFMFGIIVYKRPKHLYSPAEFPTNLYDFGGTHEDPMLRISSIDDQLKIVFGLLIRPGYDSFLVYDILKKINRSDPINISTISEPRGITPETVSVIIRYMINRGLVDSNTSDSKLFLTESGEKLLNYLNKYLD